MRHFISIIATLLFIFTQGQAFAGGLQNGIGKVIQPKKELNLPYKYYVTIQKSDGTVLAFPVKSKDINLKLMKKNQMYMMTFTTETEKLTLGEKTQDFTIMNLIKAKYLTLKELGTMGITTENIQKNAPPQKSQKQGLRINDKLTNSIIATAGALLLGSMLID